MKRNKKIIIVTVCALVMGNFLHAKVRAVMTRRDLENAVSKGAMVVALFYESQKDNRTLRNQNKGLMSMYDDVSGYQTYDDADVIFLKVNVGRKDLADLAGLYGVTTIPTFIFFNHGKRLIDSNGSAIDLKGFIVREDLQSFIDRYYGAQIKKYVAHKEDRKNQIIEQENESWKPYFYPRDMVVRGYAPDETQHNME